MLCLSGSVSEDPNRRRGEQNYFINILYTKHRWVVSPETKSNQQGEDTGEIESSTRFKPSSLPGHPINGTYPILVCVTIHSSKGPFSAFITSLSVNPLLSKGSICCQYCDGIAEV